MWRLPPLIRMLRALAYTLPFGPTRRASTSHSGPFLMVAESVRALLVPSCFTVPFRRGPERLAFDASARPHSAGKPPPGPKAVGSKPPGPPSTTNAPLPGAIRRLALPPSDGASVPIRIQSGLRALAWASLLSVPPPALMSLGPVLVGTILRQTEPSDGQGGCAGSSSVIVAPNSGSRLLVLVLASGVAGPALSPGGGDGGAVSGRSSSETRARSLSG